MRRLLSCFVLFALCIRVAGADKPNVVLVMSDDQGWGETGYYNHPVLKTPNLDSMAKNGLRFDRFYAAGPVCSPTRASVLTGRTHDRTGVFSHGYALRHQEKSIVQAMKKAGYATGHFGKWHLNGLRGPGVPVLTTDTHHPGTFGFDEWLTVTNFFDMNPLMGHSDGKFLDFKGDSSEVIVAEALKFIKRKVDEKQRFLAVIWYGTPHSPFRASEEDMKPFAKLDTKSKAHYGELVAMDRSIGTLRSGLREYGVADNTLVWFCSDNGGLGGLKPGTVGGLRGNKGSIWEGGIRVPAIIEWPARVKPRITNYPASTMDIAPTLVSVLGLPKDSLLDKIDGESLAPLFENEIGPRKKLIPFHFQGNTVLIDNDYKIVRQKNGKGKYELYNLKNDVKESKNIFSAHPEIAQRLRKALDEMTASVAKSVEGADYPEGKVDSPQPPRIFWRDSPAYKPYLQEFAKRPEYKGQIGKKRGGGKKARKKKKK